MNPGRTCILLICMLLLAFPVWSQSVPAGHTVAAADALEDQAAVLQRQARHAEALVLLRQALEIRRRQQGDHAAETARVRAGMATSSMALGRLEPARALLERALADLRQTLGPTDPRTLRVQGMLANLCLMARRFQQAEALLTDLAARAPDAGVYRALGILYRQTGRQSAAEEAFGRGLVAAGPDALQKASVQVALAQLRLDQDRMAEAQTLLQDAVRVRQRMLGGDDPLTLVAVEDLAVVYGWQNDFARATAMLEAVLKAPAMAGRPRRLALQHLARIQHAEGDYAAADRSYHLSLQGEADPQVTADALAGLAEVKLDQGDFAAAESLARRALALRRQALGPDDPDTGESLNLLGLLYTRTRDFPRAERYYQTALKLLGDRAEAARVLHNLALCQAWQGKTAAALDTMQRAAPAYRATFGPSHPRTLQMETSLASLQAAAGDRPGALARLRDVLARGRDVLARPDLATVLNNLAGMEAQSGDVAGALRDVQEALAITTAVEGPDTPDAAVAWRNLAMLEVAAGRRTDALDAERRHQAVEDRLLSSMLSYTSEGERLAWQTAMRPYDVLASLGAAADLCRAVLRRKAVVLDSLLEDRLIAAATRQPAVAELREHLLAARSRLTRLILNPPPDGSATARRTELEQTVATLEGQLARQVSGAGRVRRALAVTPEAVQGALPADAVLVEYVTCAPWPDRAPRYGAVVLPARGGPRWVLLDRTQAVDRLVQEVREGVRSLSGPTPESLRALDRAVWEPVAAVLPAGVRTVVLSPDGPLNLVSFAALLQGDRTFLGERYALRYVSSGRDLVTRLTLTKAHTMVLMGNPTFGAGQLLPPLPGTEAECRALADASRPWGWSPQLWTGREASKARLEKLRAPWVLHLATHGFFLPEEGGGTGGDRGLVISLPRRDDEAVPASRIPLMDPMYRSGLAFSGAESTLEAWLAGQPPGAGGNGVLTAAEAGLLDLRGTWLVTLSACDTGTGRATRGEGVLGLRRGFAQAGAAHLLLTLWPIADADTARFMRDFYAAAHQSGDPAIAMGTTQRSWLRRLRQSRGVSAAAQVAGPFILTSQGPVQNR